MEHLAPASDAEVVLAFLRAEIDSPRFRLRLLLAMQKVDTSRDSLIDHADLTDGEQNRTRRQLLASAREPLFNHFPRDVLWWRGNVLLQELELIEYPNYRRFLELSGGRRSVRAGAARALNEPQILGRDLHEMLAAIPKVIDGVKAGRMFPELIAVRDPRLPRCVLVKGSLRATAYVIAGLPARVDIYLGTSDFMREWWLF
jgi:hypothetical protein